MTRRQRGGLIQVLKVVALLAMTILDRQDEHIKLYGLMWNMGEKEWCVLIYGRSRLAN